MFVVVSVVCTVGVVVIFCVVMMKKRERRVEEWRWKKKKRKERDGRLRTFENGLDASKALLTRKKMCKGKNGGRM